MIPATGTVTLRGAAARHGIQVEFKGAATNIRLGAYYRGGARVPTGSKATIATAGIQKFSNYRGATAAPPKIVATGGVITTRGGWRSHTLCTNGNFVVTTAGPATYLIVGGGGTGGHLAAGTGGGGGGGVLTASGVMFAIGSYAASIGIGGKTGPMGSGHNGGDSTFKGLVAKGGGGGTGVMGLSGGSGGGGGGNSVLVSPGGPGTAGQGFAGGTAVPFTNSFGVVGSDPFTYGGGGGGARGPGLPGGVAGSGASWALHFAGNGGPGYVYPHTGLDYGAGGGGSLFVKGYPHNYATYVTGVKGGPSGGDGGDERGRGGAGVNCRGGGGGGGVPVTMTGGPTADGGGGVVIISYPFP
jgi:hypothetical protein